MILHLLLLVLASNLFTLDPKSLEMMQLGNFSISASVVLLYPTNNPTPTEQDLYYYYSYHCGSGMSLIFLPPLV